MLPLYKASDESERVVVAEGAALLASVTSALLRACEL